MGYEKALNIAPFLVEGNGLEYRILFLIAIIFSFLFTSISLLGLFLGSSYLRFILGLASRMSLEPHPKVSALSKLHLSYALATI